MGKLASLGRLTKFISSGLGRLISFRSGRLTSATLGRLTSVWGGRLVVERPAGVCNRPADSSGLSLSPGELPGGGQSGVLH